MQSGLQFFDMPIKGDTTGKTQKIAIKSSECNTIDSTNDDSFSAVMNTLMALSPEHLETSLSELEWIPVDDNVNMLAPLIDLSGLENAANSEGHPDRFLVLIENGIKKSIAPSLHSASAGPQSPVDLKPLTADQGNTTFTPEIAAKDLEGQLAVSAKNTVEDTADPIRGDSTKTSHHCLENPRQEVKMTAVVKDENLIVSELKSTKEQNLIQENTSVSASQKKVISDAHPKLSLVNNRVTGEGEPASTPSLNTDRFVAEGETTKNTRAIKAADSMPTREAKGFVEDLEKQPFTEKPPSINLPDKKSAPKIQMEQFKTVSEPMSTGHDKGVLTVNPMNDGTLKASLRQNAKSATSPVENIQTEIKPDQVQPNSSIKDSALSFSSRWGAMLGKNLEMANESKPTEAAPDRTDPNDVIRQIVQRMTLKNSRLQSQMNIKLKPEFLGNIRMQITSDNQQVAVRMVADSNGVKEMIEQNIQFLKAELQQHGLEIDKFDVFVGSDNDELRQEQQAQLRQRAKQKGEGFDQKKDIENDSDDKEPTEDKNAIHASASDSEIDYFA